MIEDQNKSHQMVAEEMLVWGYKGSPEDNKFITSADAMNLLMTSLPSANITMEAVQSFFENEIKVIKRIYDNGNQFNELALERSRVLIEAHERFRKAMGGTKFQVVEPVLPMDILGMYIILPDKN